MSSGERTHLWTGVLQDGFSSRAVPSEIEHNEGYCDEVTVPLSSAVSVSRKQVQLYRHLEAKVRATGEK